LEVFNALMKAGTTVAAAELLSISQPSVSKALKHLEGGVGVPLFERIGGRLRPTPEARRLYGHVRSVFARLDTVDRISQDIRDCRNETISVASGPLLGNSLLARSVARFQMRHPDVQVVFRSVGRRDTCRRVADGEADFGLLYSPSDRAGVEIETLMSVDLVCVVPVDHALARQPSVTFEDLRPFPLISYRPGTPIGTQVAAAFRAEGVERPIDLQTSLSSSACVLVAEGAGIALTDPLAFLMTDFPELTVRRIKPRIAIKIQLAVPSDHPVSTLATRLIREVRQVAAEMSKRIDRLSAAIPAGVGRPETAAKHANGRAVPSARRTRIRVKHQSVSSNQASRMGGVR
jgi:DNA-binding transcriptional LysR family regulator